MTLKRTNNLWHIEGWSPWEFIIKQLPAPPHFRLRLVRDDPHGPPRWEVRPLSDADFPRGYGIETPVYPLLDKDKEPT